MRPTCAVAVPTYGREAVLVATLEQIYAQTVSPDEILVIDQTPVHETATRSYLDERSRRGRLRWLQVDEANLPRARNIALKASRCDIVIFIDDDVILSPQFVEHHLINYSNPEIHAVAGR